MEELKENGSFSSSSEMGHNPAVSGIRNHGGCLFVRVPFLALFKRETNMKPPLGVPLFEDRPMSTLITPKHGQDHAPSCSWTPIKTNGPLGQISYEFGIASRSSRFERLE